MSCWKILGIEQTTDLAVIKTAYAAKAKEWHPEEHPEEFQQLQQAYRSASRFAKAQKGRIVNPAAAKTTVEDRQNAVMHEEVSVEKTVKEASLEKSAEKEHMPEETERKEEAAGEIQEKGETAKETEEKKEITKEIEKEAARQVIVEEIAQFQEVAEDIGESSQDYDYGELIQSFDYEMVEETDLKDRFFKEFFSIAWNPYLMNNLICWEYILKRSPYERLLTKTAFRYNFVRTACSLSGWQRKTILFFEKWLQSCPAADADNEQKKETDLFWWKFNRIGLFGKLVPIQRCVTNEQKVLHDVFLSKVKRCGRDTGLASETDVECYLSFYLPYAAAKQSKIKDLYQGSCQGRTFFLTLLLMVPLIIGMVIYVNVCVVPQQNEKAAQEIEQQRIQQQADEIRKYYEMLQEDDSSGLEWTPEYREELMRKVVLMQEELLREQESIPESEVIADADMEMGTASEE
ncbi:MAG: DnaJ domain-containing protein [Lachnospiraceae bacterium]|nr:DnaJ domain-containing protein [Lachnospiraceae bacterium]